MPCNLSKRQGPGKINDMKTLVTSFLLSLTLAACAANPEKKPMQTSVHDFKMNRIDGTPMPLSEYKGKVLLIVNVASKCGLTPQYDGLEKIYEKYKEQGFEVLGFPANEFLGQEPGTNADIQEFCRTNFGVKFPMFEKIVVKGKDIHPLYNYLINTKKDTTQKKGGTLMERLMAKNLLSKDHEIHWNFEKFLVDRNGKIVERFSPELTPEDPVITAAIEKTLKQ